MDKAQEHIWTSPKARKATIDVLANFRYGTRRSILKPLLHVAVAVFFWIYFRSIGGHRLDHDLWVLR